MTPPTGGATPGRDEMRSSRSFTLEERVQLVARVQRAGDSGDREGVRSLLDPLLPWILDIEPELGLYYLRLLVLEGRFREGLELLHKLHPLIEATGDWRLIARYKNLMGQVLFWLWEPHRAQRVLLEALAMAESHWDVKLCGYIQSNLGMVAAASGHNEQ